MLETNTKIIEPSQVSNLNNQDFDFKLVFNFFIRNKNFLGKISLIFLLLGSLVSFIPKKVWEGQFQIVLNLEDNTTSLGIPDPRSLLSGTSEDLKTEVGILKSPSILIPVYEFMLAKKDEEFNKKYDFYKWRKSNLTIGLEKGTSILNIAYRDKDKTLIIPVLGEISSSYQKYAQLRKKKLLEARNNDLRKQINIYKKTTAKSLKTAQEYAIDKDLTFFDTRPKRAINENRFNPNDLEVGLTGLAYPKVPALNQNLNSDLEAIRIQAVNQIRKIDLQLKKIEDLENLGELQYIGSTIPSIMRPGGLAEGLEKIDNQLVEQRSKYTDEDISIKRLLEKREYMLDALRKRAVNYLKAKRIETEATRQSVIRPKGVLLKYKELIRIADRDENTLVNLEDELRENEISLSKQKYPWELITEPTLLRNPVSPRKLNIIFLSLLFGLFLGVAYSLYKEKKSGIIFELKQILEIRSFKFVERMSLDKNKLNENKITLIKDFIKDKSNSNGTANIIFIGDLNENKKTNYCKTLQEEIDPKLVFIKKFADLEIVKNKNINIIVLTLGKVNYSQIEMLDKYAELLNINIPGLIIIED